MSEQTPYKWDNVSVRVDRWKRLQALCEELEPHQHYDGQNECQVCDEPLTDALVRHLETLAAQRTALLAAAESAPGREAKRSSLGEDEMPSEQPAPAADLIVKSNSAAQQESGGVQSSATTDGLGERTAKPAAATDPVCDCRRVINCPAKHAPKDEIKYHAIIKYDGETRIQTGTFECPTSESAPPKELPIAIGSDGKTRPSMAAEVHSVKITSPADLIPGLERAAEICDERSEGADGEGWSYEARQCARAIRAEIEKEKVK